jgi:hypothetical protein
MGYIFDGSNKIITLTAGTITLDVKDLYSRWKDWVGLSDNSKFDPAFANSVGGDSLGGGQFIGGYFFLQNGWLIRPQEANHTLFVEGNLFPIPDSAPLFTLTTGDYQVNIQMRVSSLTQAVSTGGSGGGDSPWDSSQVNFVISKLTTNEEKLVEILKYFMGRIKIDTNTNTIKIYDPDDPGVIFQEFPIKGADGNPNSEDIYEIG